MCDLLLTDRHPTLRVSYLDYDKQHGKTTQYAVLIRGISNQLVKELLPGQRPVEEVYRIRLPVNIYSGRGIVIGEGKPENQNHGKYCGSVLKDNQTPVKEKQAAYLLYMLID